MNACVTRALARAQSRNLSLLAVCLAVTPGLAAATGTWQTTLQPRDFDLDGRADGYYDTVLNVTWLANGNALAGTVHDIGSPSNPSTTDGLTDWLNASAWVGALRVKGVGGWRLPAALDTGTPGCNFSTAGTDCGANPNTAASELAHLFFVTLGNLAQIDPVTGQGRPSFNWGLLETGPFIGLEEAPYWSGGSSAADPTRYWYFFMFNGTQFLADRTSVNGHVIPVRNGDTPNGSGVRGVPLPGWASLLALCLLVCSGVSAVRGLQGVMKR